LLTDTLERPIAVQADQHSRQSACPSAEIRFRSNL
jgi:hypothetical protein